MLLCACLALTVDLVLWWFMFVESLGIALMDMPAVVRLVIDYFSVCGCYTLLRLLVMIVCCVLLAVSLLFAFWVCFVCLFIVVICLFVLVFYFGCIVLVV